MDATVCRWHSHLVLFCSASANIESLALKLARKHEQQVTYAAFNGLFATLGLSFQLPLHVHCSIEHTGQAPKPTQTN